MCKKESLSAFMYLCVWAYACLHKYIVYTVEFT